MAEGFSGEIGGWTLLERLGSGGMGVVWKAQRGGEVAAVKLIHTQLAADKEFRKRFRREVVLSQLVDGPHLARIIDFDLDAAVPWMASALLDGLSLGDRVATGGPIVGAELLTLGRGIALGLTDLCEAGVVHRDLKPSNIMMTPTGPVLVDLGIARAAELTSFTRTGLRLGSPGWMAPEQIETGVATAATDVFGWALCVAYAATGVGPFGSGPSDAVLYRIRHDAPDLIGVPAVWRPLIASALSKDPAKRPQAFELVSATADFTTLGAWSHDARGTGATTVLTSAEQFETPTRTDGSTVLSLTAYQQARPLRAWHLGAAIVATTLVVGVGVAVAILAANGHPSRTSAGNSPSQSPTAGSVAGTTARSTRATPSLWTTYQPYVNPRFGFKVDVPEMLSPLAPPTDGDGQSFASSDGLAVMTAYGMNNNATQETPQSASTADGKQITAGGGRITYSVVFAHGYALSGYNGTGQVFYDRQWIYPNAFYSLEWTYPPSDQAEIGLAVDHTSTAFVPGTNAMH